MSDVSEPHSAPLLLANRIAQHFSAIPEVEAVALAGSRLSPLADERSDIDLYVYGSRIVGPESRRTAATGAVCAEIGNSTWEPGDEWIDSGSGVSVDVMFRTTGWIEDQLRRSLELHEASAGYSTCFWYNVRNSLSLYDRSGWFAALQREAARPYPEELAHAIVARNHPLLRANLSSYLHQIELALYRDDPVSVTHRVAALLASYFDILFAVNRQPHPGEKRLLQFAPTLCRELPDGMADQVTALLRSVPDGPVVGCANRLIDTLDMFLSRR